MLVAPLLCSAQSDNGIEKWYSTAEVELISPYSGTYHYGIENTGYQVKLNKDLSLGVLYSLNYNLFTKLSVGVVAGYQAHFNPDFHLPKIGAVVRYFFVDPDNVYVYLHDAHTFSFNPSRFEYGNNLRLGLGFPILKKESFNLNTNIFYEQNYVSLNKSDPLFFQNADPGDIYFYSIGVSLGVKF